LMELRKQKGKLYVDIEDNMSESGQKLVKEDDGKWTEEDFDKVHECLASLSPEHAACVRLFYLAQTCYTDIAEEAGYELNEGKCTEEDFYKVHECLASLSSEQAVCVRLFYLEQKCYKELAEEAGYDLNKMKSYIQNGKRNLKICMERGNKGK